MKFPKLPLAGTLLVSYSFYTLFVPVSIAHSIILLALAGLTAFDHYLKQHLQPRMDQKMSEFQQEVIAMLKAQKEELDTKLMELKNYQTKQAMDKASVAAKPKQTIQF